MPHPRKPPQIKPPKEEQLHKAVIQYLHATLHPDVIFFHTANQAHLAGNTHQRCAQINKLKAMGYLPGVSDLQIIWPVESKGIFGSLIHPPRMAFLELKRDEKCKLTDAQETFKDRANHIGVYVGTANSLEGVQWLLKEWRVPTKAGRAHAN